MPVTALAVGERLNARALPIDKARQSPRRTGGSRSSAVGSEGTQERASKQLKRLGNSRLSPSSFKSPLGLISRREWGQRPRLFRHPHDRDYR